MNRLLLLFLLSILLLPLFSIEYFGSTQRSVHNESKNGQNLYYHSNSEDYIFYGSNKWAVNFKVNNIIEHPDADTFLVNGLNIYLPQSVNNVRVYLHDNYLSQPGNILYNLTTNLLQGWNYIALPEQKPVVNAWLVLEFDTSENGHWVSASNGNGLNSYYYDRFDNNAGLFRSFGLNGFKADLLFNLVGSFNSPILMIDILEFSNPYSLRPRELYLPRFKIKNNSPFPVRDVYVKLNVSNSNIHFSITDSLYIASEMAVNQEIDSRDINFSGIELPEIYAQYEVSLITGCNPQGYALLKKTKYTDINLFEFDKAKSLLEVFSYTGDSVANDLMNYIDRSVNKDSVDVVYYFPNSIDPWFTWAAYHRSLQYLHQGNQHTYFNGDLRVSNFADLDFYSLFDNAYNLSIKDKTFITARDFSVALNENNYLNIGIEFENQNTSILNKYQNSSFLNLAFAQKVSYNNKNITLITQYITTGFSGTSVILPKGSSESFNYTYAIYNIDLLEGNRLEDIFIFAWIQNRLNKKIYFYDFLSLADINYTDNINILPSNSDDVVLYPNPVNLQDNININFINTKTANSIKISLYNVKGQKVMSQDLQEHKIDVKSLNINSSGIYFLRVNWLDEGKQNSQIKRILILK